MTKVHATCGAARQEELLRTLLRFLRWVSASEGESRVTDPTEKKRVCLLIPFASRIRASRIDLRVARSTHRGEGIVADLTKQQIRSGHIMKGHPACAVEQLDHVVVSDAESPGQILPGHRVRLGLRGAPCRHSFVRAQLSSNAESDPMLSLCTGRKNRIRQRVPPKNLLCPEKAWLSRE